MLIRLLVVISLLYWTSRGFSAIDIPGSFLTRCDVVSQAAQKELTISSMRIEKLSAHTGRLHLVTQVPGQADYEVKTVEGQLKADGQTLAFAGNLNDSSKVEGKNSKNKNRAAVVVKGHQGTMSIANRSYPVTCR